MRSGIIIVTGLVGALAPVAGIAAEPLAGPVRAEVVRVIDGDTMEISAQVWLNLRLSSHVRIRGIDTPEMHGKCLEEKTLAAAARDRLAELAGASVRLANIAEDKFGGRVLADVTADNGTDLRVAMVASGLARPYDGTARQPWCPVAGVVN
jgi:micrococcal nuclease